jgi:hypothetical protein
MPLEDEEFTFEAEIFTRRIRAAESGFTVTAALREEIMACGDTVRLEDALLRAATGDPGQAFTF